MYNIVELLHLLDWRACLQVHVVLLLEVAESAHWPSYQVAKFDNRYFIYFFRKWGHKIVHKKFKVILSKIEGITAIFVILDYFDFLSKFIITPHVIPYWNPWDHGSSIGLFSRFCNQSGLGRKS